MTAREQAGAGPDASRIEGPEPVDRPEQLSAEWITAALRHAGLDTEVTDLSLIHI